MKIIVDAFGGDNAPQEILLGCAQARQELGVDILLTGDKARLEACAKELNVTRELAAMEILHHAQEPGLFYAHRRGRQRGLPPGDARPVWHDGRRLYEERHGH